MSLDFYLEGPEIEEECTCWCCNNKHIRKGGETFFHINITHNLAQMASRAGIYECLWRPDEHKWEFAHQIINKLENGIELLSKDFKKWEKLNPDNGWGSHANLLESSKSILEACKKFPNAIIKVCR